MQKGGCGKPHWTNWHSANRAKEAGYTLLLSGRLSLVTFSICHAASIPWRFY